MQLAVEQVLYSQTPFQFPFSLLMLTVTLLCLPLFSRTTTILFLKCPSK